MLHTGELAYAFLSYLMTIQDTIHGIAAYAEENYFRHHKRLRRSIDSLFACFLDLKTNDCHVLLPPFFSGIFIGLVFFENSVKIRLLNNVQTVH